MLCIGGSQIPFGWSFLSISKLPMIWNEGDVWTAEVDLPVNSRMDYKYVILEEQDWTKQESEDAEGVVTFSYRDKPDEPPDVQTIQKQMAIVAWQPGPNRVVQVPSEEEISSLQRGEVRERKPARMPTRPYIPRRFPGPSLGQALRNIKPPSMRPPPPPRTDPQEDELAGTWEVLSLGEDSGEPLLERRDVWGMSDLQPPKPVRFG
ncbi:hypothetical protein WJX84_005381 [Apatococcus fuscideae]|uniref:CBM20 domain-containing protein n=1 Tax=Apatococcus fuscideae TaxID=2026836 RepID=A0AAW1SLG3_9CHLO